jgi:hypothetical protein
MADDALDEKRWNPDSAKARELHKKALRRFNECVLPQLEQRRQSLTARRFVSIPGAMWEGEWGEQFENSIKVEINKTLRGVRKIENDYRQNRIVPDFRPSGKEANSETADLLDGLHRADSYKFKAQQARDNAFAEAVKGGFGAYRLTNELADPFDPECDEQRVNPALIIVDADQSVFFDGNAKLYDKSDARFAYVITADTRDAAEEEFGEEKIVSWDKAVTHTEYDWFTPDLVRKCEYYEIEETDEKLWIFTHPLSDAEERWYDSEIDDEYRSEKKTTGWKSTSRTVKRRRVHKYLMNGAVVLKDHGLLAGENIPIVPVYGVREYVDGQERFKGHVIDKMDAQRLYNAKVSKAAEMDALAPREKPIFLAEQMPPALAALWKRQEIDRHPYALVNPVFDPVTGGIAAMGPIGKIEAPQLPPVTAALMQIANNDLTEDDQDGADQVKSNVSEEAMDIAATRVDMKSGIYLDNMRQSVQREGEIYFSMAREVYFEPGRIVETMTEDGDDGEGELHQRVTDRSTGESRIINDLQRGRYKVIVDVMEATATRRDKTSRRLIEMADVFIQGQDLEAANAMLSTALLNSDGEGISDLQDWLRGRLLKAGVVKPTDEEKAQLEKAAEQQQQPDPMAQAQVVALQTSAAKDAALADKAKADTEQSHAKTVLTYAQASAVGGPEAVPEAPTGLEHAAGVVDVAHKAADTQLKEAQAEHLRHDMTHKTIKRGHDFITEQRAQDLAEKQAQQAKAA